MTTVINTPAPTTQADSGGGMGFVLGAVILLIVVVVGLVYGIPAIQNAGTRVQESAPSGTSINVPDQIDVNVNTPEGQ